MFTESTRQFGTWKKIHRSFHWKNPGSPASLVVAFGMCAFVCFLVFFLTLRLRSDFFVLENSNIALENVQKPASHLLSARTAAVRLGVKEFKKTGELKVLFESGKVIRFPSQKKEFYGALAERVSESELTSLLTLVANPAVSRVQIWPEKGLSSQKLSQLLEALTDFGFDDFDIAVEVL